MRPEPPRPATPRLPLPRTPEAHEIQTLHLDLEPEPERSKLKVLLLEDRSDFRHVLEDHLASSYRVTSVSSGTEGLREVMKGPFDLIVCDMMMPQMGGEMFYWAVTRVRPAARHRFVFFTGHRNKPELELFFQKINAIVLLKPFRLGALEMAIRDVLRKVG